MHISTFALDTIDRFFADPRRAVNSQPIKVRKFFQRVAKTVIDEFLTPLRMNLYVVILSLNG